MGCYVCYNRKHPQKWEIGVTRNLFPARPDGSQMAHLAQRHTIGSGIAA